MRSPLLVALLVASCGPGETPTPFELVESEEYAAKGNGNAYGHDEQKDSEFLRGLHKGWFKHGKGHKKDPRHLQCMTREDDPFADQMPTRSLRQDFEKEPLGPLAQVYHWADVPGSLLEVTQAQAFEGKRSLKVSAPATTGYHYFGPRFCVRCEATQRFNAEFAVRFENFASWTGLMVTNNPDYAYWWWVRSDGTVFENATFAQLKAKTWHQVRISIDRTMDQGTISIDGVAHTMPLTGTWYEGAAEQPMGCFRLLLLSKAAQTVYLDNIKVRAIK